MIEVIHGPPQPQKGNFTVIVEAETPERAQAITFAREEVRFLYGPHGFASADRALDTALEWADQYGVPRIYVN